LAGDSSQVSYEIFIEYVVRDNKYEVGYAKHFELDPDSITLVDVIDKGGNPLWPHDPINDRIAPGAVITIIIRESGAASSETLVIFTILIHFMLSFNI